MRVLHISVFLGIIPDLPHANLHLTHLRCQKILYFSLGSGHVPRPHQNILLPPTFSPNVLVIASRAQPDHTLEIQQNGCTFAAPIVLPPCDFKGFLCCTHGCFPATLLLETHANVHKNHLCGGKNNLYFRSSQEHVLRTPPNSISQPPNCPKIF